MFYILSRNNQVAGFSLIEVVVVMGLFVLLASFGVVVSMDNFRAHMFRDERSLLVTVLQKARSQAMNNICLGLSCSTGLPHGVHVEAGKYIIFQGNGFVTGDSTNQIFQANTAINVIPSGSEVIFEQLSGRTDTDWEVALNDNLGHATTISVNREGRIEY